MSDYGAIAAKSGTSINDAINKELRYLSSKRHIQLRAKGIANSASFDFAHGLGYRPAFTGYIVDSGKYFLNYFIAPLDGFSFENTTYGDIYSDTTNIHCECASANKLAYLCYLNPGDNGANATSPVSTGDYGFASAPPGVDINTAEDGELSITSKYPGVLIIAAGEITINVSAITAVGATITKQSDVVDLNHNLGVAHHILMPEFYTAGLFNLATRPTGFFPPYVLEEHEAYIDATKIRYRVSRIAEGSDSLGDAHADAKTVTVKYFITNIKLPT